MRARVAVPLVFAAVCVSGARAQEQPSAVTVKAERTQQVAPGVFQWSGNVVLSAGKLTLRADTVEARTEADSKRTLVIAEGNVAIERAGERLQLRRLELDLASGRGVFELQP